MSGLAQNDLQILDYYAQQGNRVLYWNYLAHLLGVDPYPALALSVVRNDNMPGSVANHYADNITTEISHKNLSERQWEMVGVDLMQIDLMYRKRMMEEPSRPDLALNLPASIVEAVHDNTFDKWGITRRAWTPKDMFVAARKEYGKNGEQIVWNEMLNNSNLGFSRGKDTLDRMFELKEHLSSNYPKRLSVAALEAKDDTSYEKYDQIGSFRLDRSGSKPQWREDVISMGNVYGHEVTEPSKIRELNDAYAIRVERLNMYKDYGGQRNSHRHPDDNFPVLESKFYISKAESIDTPNGFVAGMANEQVSPDKSASRIRLDNLLTASQSGDENALKVARNDIFESPQGQNIVAKASAAADAQEQQVAIEKTQAQQLEQQNTHAVRGPVMKIT